MINEEGCQPIIVYRQHMATKAALHRPDNIGHEALDAKPGSQVDESFLLDSSIRDILPEYLISEYDKMLAGFVDEVSPKDRASIRKIVRDLLKDK
jgi:hypothetical protein